MKGYSIGIVLAMALLSSCANEEQQESVSTPTMQQEEKPDARPNVKTTATGFAIPQGRPGTPVLLEGSSIKWKGTKPIGDAHTGTIDIKRGKVGFNEDGKLESALLYIDMSTIQVSSFETGEGDDSGPDRLRQHLLSEDFFYSEKYEMAFLEILEVEEVKGGNGRSYICWGEMTIKDITNAVNMRVHVQEEGEQRVISCNYGMDRSQWNVRYNSGSFFEELGDALIDDIIELEVRIEVQNG